MINQFIDHKTKLSTIRRHLKSFKNEKKTKFRVVNFKGHIRQKVLIFKIEPQLPDLL